MLEKYKKEIIISIISLVFIVTICDSAIEYHDTQKAQKTAAKEKLNAIDSLSFKQAFRCMYGKLGPNKTFKWRNNKYKTILKEDK